MPMFTHYATGIRLAVPPKTGYTLLERAVDADGRYLFSIDYGNMFPMASGTDAMLVRDPVERFLSAYKNKVKFNRVIEACTHWASKLVGVPPENSSEITISQLLGKIEPIIRQGEQYHLWDFHFAPQMWQGGIPEITKYYDIRYDTDFLDYLGVDHTKKPNRTDHLESPATDHEKAWIRQLYSMDETLYLRYREYREKRLSRAIVI